MPGMSPVARPPRPGAPNPSRAERPRRDGGGAPPGAVVSSPATGAPGPGKPIPPATPAENPREGHERVVVAAGAKSPIPALRGGMGGYRLNPLEIQPAKIHCPPARDDTLSRARLNSWLDRAVSGRLGLFGAAAGLRPTS